MRTGYLIRILQYQVSTNAYAEQLPIGHISVCFLYHGSLSDRDIAMPHKHELGLTILCFYKVQQDVYETYRRLGAYNPIIASKLVLVTASKIVDEIAYELSILLQCT